MELWLNHLLRQIIIYILPILISLTVTGWLESKYTHKPIPHAFFSISWRGAWWPFFASIIFMRGMIIALPQALNDRYKTSLIRFLSHAMLCLIGFILYSWTLTQQAPTGLPPIHLWWAKVFMFFNLCMLGMHFLPLPGLLMGETISACFKYQGLQRCYLYLQSSSRQVLLITLLVASPITDSLIGAYIVFPVYEQLCTLATQL